MKIGLSILMLFLFLTTACEMSDGDNSTPFLGFPPSSSLTVNVSNVDDRYDNSKNVYLVIYYRDSGNNVHFVEKQYSKVNADHTIHLVSNRIEYDFQYDYSVIVAIDSDNDESINNKAPWETFPNDCVDVMAPLTTKSFNQNDNTLNFDYTTDFKDVEDKNNFKMADVVLD